MAKKELIIDYQPITPKVGERYRVLKNCSEECGDSLTHTRIGQVLTLDRMFGHFAAFKELEGRYTGHNYLTTEYLELVEEEREVVSEYMELKPFKRFSESHPEVFKKTKQTAMQKLTSALKRVLSADKQTLYKAGYINDGLELSNMGQNSYVTALFNNEGDHKKAVAEMVAMAQAELGEA